VGGGQNNFDGVCGGLMEKNLLVQCTNTIDNVHNVVDNQLAIVPFGKKTCLPANSLTQSDTGTQRHHQLQPHPMVL
jgi:hypothetical protein